MYLRQYKRASVCPLLSITVYFCRNRDLQLLSRLDRRVESIVLQNCMLLSDIGVNHLTRPGFLSLHSLAINDCHNLSESGYMDIASLVNITSLVLAESKDVQRRGHTITDGVFQCLANALPLTVLYFELVELKFVCNFI